MRVRRGRAGTGRSADAGRRHPADVPRRRRRARRGAPGRGARPRRCVRVRPPVAAGPARAPRAVGLPAARRGGRRHRPGVPRPAGGARRARRPTRSWWRSCSRSHHMAPGRLVAGLGTGDSQSAPENHAYGIPFARADERRASLAPVRAGAGGAGHPGVGGRRVSEPTLDAWRSRPGRPSTCGRPGPPPWPPTARRAARSPGPGPCPATSPASATGWASSPAPGPPGRCARGRSRSRPWPRRLPHAAGPTGRRPRTGVGRGGGGNLGRWNSAGSTVCPRTSSRTSTR